MIKKYPDINGNNNSMTKMTLTPSLKRVTANSKGKTFEGISMNVV